MAAMRAFTRFLARFLALFAMFAMAAQPVAAQSVLRDAETERLLHDMAIPLVEAAGLEADNVDLVLINDRSINAFVAGGQAIYIHTGLIEAADTAEEVQGVIAHELGHITGGHVVRYSEGVSQATNISILSMLLEDDMAVTDVAAPFEMSLNAPRLSLSQNASSGEAITGAVKISGVQELAIFPPVTGG